uniref:Uncharacterized protein n=1 Tax=Triticum urartu TaxID=4572 RepID=A0A8R7R8G8_TRIUA
MLQVAGQGVPAEDDLRQRPRRRPLVRCLLPGRANGALLPQSAQAQVHPQLPPLPQRVPGARPLRLPPKLRRRRAAVHGLQGAPSQRRPPLPRRLPGPDVRQGSLRDAPRQPPVERDAHDPHLRRARRVL